MSQGEGESEDARFERSVRSGRGALGPIVGVLALCALAACAWLVLETEPRAYGSFGHGGGRPHTTEEETPEWLDEGSSNEEAGGAGDRKSRLVRFGLEGPVQQPEPTLAREEAREKAANAGIIGILKSSVGEFRPRSAPAQSAEEHTDDWLLRDEAARKRVSGSDPMDALGALMGDRTGTRYGFGGMGLRGTGRGGGSIELEAPPRSAAPAPPASTPPQPSSAALRPTRAARARPQLALLIAGDAPEPASSAAATPAEALLARYATLRDVRPIDAHGYFANTYLPGDPELRALQARLSSYDRQALLPADLRAARLDAGARRAAQPFDAPDQAALALFVAASERGITAARRLQVQVGLQATERRGGPRPAMKLALVVDLRQPLDGAQSALLQELLASFARARQPGDELSLHLAGPSGGLAVDPAGFRLGPLTVALQTRLARRDGPVAELAQVLRDASARVRVAESDHAVLGSSAVVLVAPHALGAARVEVEQLARQSAMDGVPVSALGLGARADAEELAVIALAGQGSRRLLRAPQDADPAVQAELAAVARVIARAVRLRVRLAPGVQLVSVLGSHPLDAPQADEVRAAEHAVDQRVARSLGIERDRGQDEEGVQIVIPAFHAGDAHVVLLDVVASGPGPIVEATVRYKDLVQLDNGVARASLALPNAALARGPLERNVLANLFAHELAGKLSAAGDAVAAGAQGRARELLGEALAVMRSLGSAVPELAADRGIAADQALLAEYEAVLTEELSPEQRAFAADSLHFASLVKLGPRPEGDLRAQL